MTADERTGLINVQPNCQCQNMIDTSSGTPHHGSTRCQWYGQAVLPDRPNVELLLDDLATLAQVGRLYLDALDADPDHELLTLTEAYRVTQVREAVERAEARNEATP